MFQHIVLLRFPEPLGEPGLVELRALLEPLAVEAEFVLGMRLGGSVTNLTGGYEYLLYVELSEQSRLPDYLSHPHHVAAGKWLGEHNVTAIVFDYPVDASTVIDA